MTIIIMENGQKFELKAGGKGNGITITGGGESAPLPAELTSKEFWDKMDHIRDVGKQLRKLARG